MEQSSSATTVDLEHIAGDLGATRSSSSLEAAAQAFASALYERFTKTFLLVRLFASARFDSLAERDRRLVENKARAFGVAGPVPSGTPVLALLGTRGAQPDWNARNLSQRFRCLPLFSSRYVGSLSMLSLQLEAMKFDLANCDAWKASVAAAGRADQWAGWVHIANPAVDRDRQGRMAVPAQDFVAAHDVRSAIGAGAGYSRHPTLLTVFAFCAEPTTPALGEAMQRLIETFRTATEPLAEAGAIFTRGSADASTSTPA
jgi:hypothetical protein